MHLPVCNWNCIWGILDGFLWLHTLLMGIILHSVRSQLLSSKPLSSRSPSELALLTSSCLCRCCVGESVDKVKTVLAVVIRSLDRKFYRCYSWVSLEEMHALRKTPEMRRDELHAATSCKTEDSPVCLGQNIPADTWAPASPREWG